MDQLLWDRFALGTPLTSEEYGPDAQAWFTAGGSGAERMAAYLGDFGNAYRYGYIVEIDEPQGNPAPTKRYAVGRFSHENAVVMPDERESIIDLAPRR